MKKTFCSVIVFALATFTTPLIWSEEAPEVSEGSVQVPGGLVETMETPKAPDQAVASSAAAEPTLEPTAVSEDTTPPSASAEADPETPTVAAPDQPGSHYSWIDKVRAQRQARMEEHREAMEARRNYHSPRDHRQYESIEKQQEKMREAWQNRTELREQAQRAHRRRANPHGEFFKDVHEARRQLIEAQAENERKQMDLLWQQQEQWMYGQMPHGWNNPWYYRGY
jgi:hypothetical protein